MEEYYREQYLFLDVMHFLIHNMNIFYMSTMAQVYAPLYGLIYENNNCLVLLCKNILEDKAVIFNNYSSLKGYLM